MTELTNIIAFTKAGAFILGYMSPIIIGCIIMAYTGMFRR